MSITGGIIAACPLMGLALSDRLDVSPMQAGHRPLCHTVLSQHPTRTLRDKTREPEQSQSSDGPCTSTGSKSYITPLQIPTFKPRANGAPGVPCHDNGGNGAGIMDTAPHPGAAMEPQMGLGAGNFPLRLCPGHGSWRQPNCCLCSLASNLGWEDPGSPGSQTPSELGAPWPPPCYKHHHMTPSPSVPPCPTGSSLSSTAPSSRPSKAASPLCPSLTSGAPAALSLLAGEMREVSLGAAAGNICSSVVQLTPPAPGSRKCCVSISLAIPAPAASAAAGRKPVGHCLQLVPGIACQR